jgi:site-specific recombinase XerD
MIKRLKSVSGGTKKKQESIISAKCEWEEVLGEFLLLKQAQGLSKTTLNDYKDHVRRFFKRFPYSWGNPDLKKSLIEYLADDVKPATFNLRLIYVKAFLEYCVNENYLQENPLKDFKKKKANGRIVEIEEDILQKLLTLPDQETFTGLRDYALLIFTLDTGIRPKEALTLTEDDFDLKHCIVNIPENKSKTRVSRSLPMLNHTADIIGQLIKAHFDGWSKDRPVFCTCEGLYLNRNTWGDRLEIYSKKLGVKIRPYDLRHVFALMYLRNGGHAFGLQKMLGHTDISMTRRYVNLSGNDLKETHRNASPLNSLVTNSKKGRIRIGKI